MIGPRKMGDAHGVPEALQRQNSTKQLISQYESLSKSYDAPMSHPSTPSKSFLSRSSQKERSPMRQSIQNLFSALKSLRPGKVKQTDPPLSSFRKQRQPILDDHPSLNAPPVLRSRSRKLTSSVLYLHRPPSSSLDLKPVWTSCTATLEPGAIVVVVGHDSPVQLIELSNCTDVRSLALQQLSPEEGVLLPKKGENEEFKVFELLFEGRPREKFAVNSVQERAGDTILPSQDQEGNQTLCPRHSEKVQSPPPAPILDLQPRSQRSLPPIPMKIKTVTPSMMTSVPSNSSRMSSGSTSVTRQLPASKTSLAAAENVRPMSPSIANLSQLSVVRQRLGRLKETSSRSSQESVSPPMSLTLSAQTSSTPPDLCPLSENAGFILRECSVQSSTADSILDSYGDSSSTIINVTLPAYSNFEPKIDPQYPPSLRSTRQKLRCVQPSRGCLETVTESLHDQVKRYNASSDLTGQVSFSQKGDSSTTRNVGFDGGDAHVVLEMVARLEEQAQSNGEVLTSIQRKMDDYMTPDRVGNGLVRKEIKTLGADLMKDLADIRTLISSKDQNTAPVELKNLGRRSHSDPAAGFDIADISSKIGGLHAAPSKETPFSETRVVALLEETLAKASYNAGKDNERLELQAQQQSETVRYLTELNSWLEALLSHDRVGKHDLSIKIDQLCQFFYGTGGRSNLAENIHELARGMESRDHIAATLQASVDRLQTLFQQNSMEIAMTRIEALVDHQRQSQEQLIRELGTGMSDEMTGHVTNIADIEISNEIKGERLRFVDAMKEATEINVQTQIKQFKEELKHEVLDMTEEVGRLHQDRQAMQNQIADLFEFYRKQKASVNHDRAS
ncbi:hypothetical protein H0H93_005835 [Arthromyces matolae]|nr:hypothetical protein H0H93_005835 [Arthromyces matolae]